MEKIQDSVFHDGDLYALTHNWIHLLGRKERERMHCTMNIEWAKGGERTRRLSKTVTSFHSLFWIKSMT